MEPDYNRLTELSRKSITKAHRIASEANHDAIRPEVLLVAIMQEGREMVYYILQRLNVDRTIFFQSVGELLRDIPCTGNGQPNLSDEVKGILAKAQNLAQNSASEVVSVEHIFWALGVTRGRVRDLMRSYGITDDELATSVDNFRNGVDDEEEEDSSSIGGISVLTQYATNLTNEAAEGEIEPVIGRVSEIRQILQVLSRKNKNNPMLVGAPGTGKTAIIEGLAHRIIRGDVPTDLKRSQIYSLDFASLTAGASMQGEFEERLKGVIQEVKRNKNIILFIDEIHLLMGSGSGTMNAANILKPAMARGEIKVIGATTTDEFVKHIESDKAFERRFHCINVEEPDIDSAITILRGIKPRFETFHRIKILDQAIVAAVKLSARYINDRFLPDKAIDIIDEAAAKMRIERSSVPEELDNISRQIRNKEMERESIVQDGGSENIEGLNLEIANLREQENVLSAKWQNERIKFEELQSLQDELALLTNQYNAAEEASQFDLAIRLKRKIDELNNSINEKAQDINSEDDMMLKSAIDEDDIRQIITAMTGIPVNKMDDEESAKLMNLEQVLHNTVIGQDAAVCAVSKVIKRNRMGFGDPNKPIGSFLFLGTTGVGKTELSKAIAEYLFDSRDMIVRIDMSEYQQEHSVSRLFGAPPGYVGYDQGGQLTEAVRRKPYCVILLDEVEKAHKKVFETLLQVLDDGRMTDGQGRVVNFKNTIIIMTSNMGAEDISRSIDAEGVMHNEAELINGIKTMMKQRISPEFVNRIDEIIMFKPLTVQDIAQIVMLQVNKMCDKLLRNGIDIRVTDNALIELTKASFDPTMGARPVKRIIDQYILDDLSQDLLADPSMKEHPITVDALRPNPDNVVFCFVKSLQPKRTLN